MVLNSSAFIVHLFPVFITNIWNIFPREHLIFRNSIGEGHILRYTELKNSFEKNDVDLSIWKHA